MARSQILRLIDVDSIEVRLSNPKIPETTVEEFYRFGALLFSEIQQRGAEVDRKLTNILGWSLATLAFFLFNQSKYMQSWNWVKVVVLLAAVLSFGCVAIAAFALKTKMWPSARRE